MFLVAWIFLAAAVASLYAGLSDEGHSFLYLSMAASAVTVILVVAQLRRGSPSRAGSADGGAEPSMELPSHGEDATHDRAGPGPSSPER
jgi:hypothetical protein